MRAFGFHTANAALCLLTAANGHPDYLPKGGPPPIRYELPTARSAAFRLPPIDTGEADQVKADAQKPPATSPSPEAAAASTIGYWQKFYEQPGTRGSEPTEDAAESAPVASHGDDGLGEFLRLFITPPGGTNQLQPVLEVPVRNPVKSSSPAGANSSSAQYITP